MSDLNIPVDKKLCLALYWVDELLNLHCIMVGGFLEKLIASFLIQFLVYFKTDTVHFALLLNVCINMQYNSLS